MPMQCRWSDFVNLVTDLRSGLRFRKTITEGIREAGIVRLAQHNDKGNNPERG
jgi:hypothetical protein